MVQRLAKSALLWLVSSRVSSAGTSQVLRCPTLTGEAVLQVLARRTGSAGAIAVTFSTGPTSTGPWAELAAADGLGDVIRRVGVQSDRLDAYVKAAYDPGSDEYDLSIALEGEAKYPPDAIATGADTITGSAAGNGGPVAADLVYESLTNGPTGAFNASGHGSPYLLDALPDSDVLATLDCSRITDNDDVDAAKTVTVYIDGAPGSDPDTVLDGAWVQVAAFQPEPGFLPGHQVAWQQVAVAKADAQYLLWRVRFVFASASDAHVQFDFTAGIIFKPAGS